MEEKVQNDWQRILFSVTQKLLFPSMAGILLQNGYVYDIEASTWDTVAFPPNNPIVQEANSAFSFRGRMTIFGNPVCDGDGQCEYREVLQYDPDGNAWVSLGKMVMDRRLHEVVEVPAEWCDLALGESPLTTTTPQTTPVQVRG